MTSAATGGGEPAEEVRAEALSIHPITPDHSKTLPVGDDYFEIVYGPLIGPTSVLLVRALVRHIAEAGGGTRVMADQLAREVGIRSQSSEPLGRSSQLAKSLRRLEHHHIVTRLDGGRIGVATRVPLLSERAVLTLPEAARTHHRMVIETLDQEDGTGT